MTQEVGKNYEESSQNETWVCGARQEGKSWHAGQSDLMVESTPTPAATRHGYRFGNTM
jgi:hypothetical protein